jgi:hypothetical protein
MKFIAAIAALTLVPVAFAGGWALHKQPAPTRKESISAHLKLDEGSDVEEWVFMPTKGPARGQAGDAVSALGLTPELKKLFGIEAGVFVVRSCVTHSTSGDPKALLDRQVVQLCTNRKVTKKQVEKHGRDEAKKAVTGRGSPALEG